MSKMIFQIKKDKNLHFKYKQAQYRTFVGAKHDILIRQTKI